MATAPVLWRYDLYHRELFLALPTLGAVAIVVSARRSRNRALFIGLLLAVAVLVKFTAVAYVIATLAAMAIMPSWGLRSAATAACTTMRCSMSKGRRLPN